VELVTDILIAALSDHRIEATPVSNCRGKDENRVTKGVPEPVTKKTEPTPIALAELASRPINLLRQMRAGAR
jgi:hypothetical protein